MHGRTTSHIGATRRAVWLSSAAWNPMVNRWDDAALLRDPDQIIHHGRQPWRRLAFR